MLKPKWINNKSEENMCLYTQYVDIHILGHSMTQTIATVPPVFNQRILFPAKLPQIL